MSSARSSKFIAATAIATIAVLTVGCGGSPKESKSERGITVYSGQHEDLTTALAKDFEAKTGIKVDVRTGKDAELANQIAEEGNKSPADVFLAEEPGPIAALAAKGKFAPVAAATLARVPDRYNPKDGTWVAFSARARVITYNPDKISESDLPASILDLADPKWKGTFGYAASGAFLGVVSYLRTTIGDDRTLDWLKGIRANGVDLAKNGAIRDAVEAGQVSFGLINHYYWFLKEAEVGTGKLKSRLHYIGNNDAGALVFTSGAAVLKSSKNADAAQRFLNYLVEADGGQKIVATSTMQYPVGKDVPGAPGLKPLESLGAPEFDQGSLSDLDGTKALLTKAGLL
jgi:iron(III) transport system substrate-binding protein